MKFTINDMYIYIFVLVYILFITIINSFNMNLLNVW